MENRIKYRFFKYLVLFTIYVFGGALVFMCLESEEAKKLPSPSAELAILKKAICRRFNATEVVVEDIFKAFQHSLDVNHAAQEPLRWDYFESYFFVGALLTTIGYGHVAPCTFAGQTFTIVYSLIGIPLTLLLIRDLSIKITHFVATIVKKVVTSVEQRRDNSNNNNIDDVIRPRSNSALHRLMMQHNINIPKFVTYDFSVKVLSIAVMLLLAISFLVISAFLRVCAEGWTFHEGFYFWYITFTTIGLGDYVPFRGKAPKSIYLRALYYVGTYYLLFGLALAASLIQCIGILLQGRIPSIEPTRSESAIRISASQDCTSNENSSRLIPHHVSFAEEERQNVVDSLKDLKNKAPTVHLCITAVACGGALNGLFFNQSPNLSCDQNPEQNGGIVREMAEDRVSSRTREGTDPNEVKSASQKYFGKGRVSPCINDDLMSV